MRPFVRERVNAERGARRAAGRSPFERRAFYRVPVALHVRYRPAGSEAEPELFATAEMRDLSGGGLSLVSAEELPDGTALELAFELPNDGLDAFARRVDVFVEGPCGRRRRGTLREAVRPFEGQRLTGTVVHGRPCDGKTVYGIRFDGIGRAAEDEISRFNHYQQLARIRHLREGARAG